MTMLSEETWRWIERNLASDTIRLRLAHHNDAEKCFAITQIECRQRASKKLSDTLNRHPRLLFDSTIAAEQSTSDAVADIHASLISPGCRVLDMTAGLGIDAMHLSGNASYIEICEADQLRARCAEINFKNAGINNAVVRCCDSVNYLATLPDNSFDVIFIDPARRGGHGQRLFALADCMPDVTAILDNMLRVAQTVIIKASPMLDITHTLGELHSVSRLMTIGTRTECKELVIECSRGFQDLPELSALTTTGNSIIEFNASRQLDDAIPAYGLPDAGDLLYEAYPAVIKLGMFRPLSDLLSVKQIAPNTHLFHSGTNRPEFPGQAFRILEITEFNKKSIKEIGRKYPKIDVTAKNIPITSAKLSERIGSKPSGQLRLFAVSAADKTMHMIVTERI